MILEVKNGSFYYKKDEPLLDDINFHVSGNEVMSILGPNGIGKTTLLKCVMGFNHWHKGGTYLDGRPMHEMKEKEIWSKISYIPQAHSNLFAYTGLEMVTMGRNVHMGYFSQPSKVDIEKSEAIMSKIGITKLASKNCNMMSGGELQMVLIARALVSDPEMIILDEPESGLDFRNQLVILDLIDQLVHEHGVSAIINTHYPGNALKISNTTLMLSRDHGYAFGPTDEVLVAPKVCDAFGVDVVFNEFCYKDKWHRDLVAVSVL